MADRSFDGGKIPEGTATHVEEGAMRQWTIQIILGLLVLAAGVLLLVETVLSDQVPGLLWAGLLAAGSAAFWYAYFAHRSWWWSAIPAGALLGAAIAPVMELDPDGAGQWTEVPFLAAVSTGFWAVYLQDHRRWWAVIPGGALLTLAVVSGVTDAVGGQGTGAILLLGLAVTFVLVAMLPSGSSRRRWAWIVAAALAAVALVVVLQTAELLIVLNYLWPVAVIGGGAYLVWSAWRRRHAEHKYTRTQNTPTETGTL
ncbi:hypothetical protein [Mycetocola miduiensis]|uniref:DUF2157 domain-containing protein n=1 Tax=Mycetocola miduiensis TaxID=995034 RepID=A0A1I5AIY5_9MICO|nr:hypothetical protein [Mycetocola miduiensis]SFN62476.1 hypothetical protein SAMN05216219_1501 [Mycetocola miduiensis]